VPEGRLHLRCSVFAPMRHIAQHSGLQLQRSPGGNGSLNQNNIGLMSTHGYKPNAETSVSAPIGHIARVMRRCDTVGELGELQ